MNLGNITWGKTSRVVKPVSAEFERSKQIQKMMDEDLRVVDIADCLGLTRAAVYGTIRRYGLKWS